MGLNDTIYTTHHFWVEMKSITEAAFTECSGLEMEVEVLQWTEGGLNEYVHRLPGRVKAGSNLVLKRGLATKELWQWHANVAKGQIQRQNISIILYGYDGAETCRWHIIGALPIKWTGPTFKADSQEVAVESIELIYQTFERE